MGGSTFIGERSRGKLRQIGLTDAQIDEHYAEFAGRYGELKPGWAGLAQTLLNEYGEAKAEKMSEAALARSYEYAAKLARLNYELTQEGIEASLDRFPRVSEITHTEVGAAADFINEYMNEAFTGALDDLVPGWKERIVEAAAGAHDNVTALTEAFRTRVLPEAMDAADRMGTQMIGIVESQLRGEIPEDVAAQLRRHAAEVSQQIGVRGQAAQYLTARDLGRTSLDLQQLGLQNAPAAIGFGTQAYSQFAEMLHAPVKSGINLSNLLSSYKAPLADVQGLYGSVLGVVSGAGLVPAGTVMSDTTQATQGAASLAVDTLGAMYGYQAQMNMNRQAMNLQQEALREQKRQNTIDNWLTGALGVAKLGTMAYLMAPAPAPAPVPAPA